MKQRVLHVYPQLNCGGTEMVLFNLIKFGDRNRFSYEILVQRDGDNEDAFRNIEVPIYKIPLTDSDDYKEKLTGFFKSEKFDVVHAHMDTYLPIVLSAAETAGVPCRVAHSHNARVDIPQLIWPLLYFKHHPYEQYANLLFGCSRLALKWLFSSKWSKGHVIHNGIDLTKFRFNAEDRIRVRQENGIADDVRVFINVGRCTDQKNQKFILDLAQSRRNLNELYIIIGDGPLYRQLNDYCEANSLSNVRMLGARYDVEQWLNAADIFLFPSIYEGLGIVAIEAEASGLEVLASSTIPSEADMNLGNFHKLPLKDPESWHNLMSNTHRTNSERARISEQATSSPYNISTVTKEVENLYNTVL